MTGVYRRHDISDAVWALLEPHLPGRAGQWGGLAQDNRVFINAVFWILRTRVRGGNQGMSRSKGGSTPRYIWPWMRRVCRSELLLQKLPEQTVQRLWR